MKILPKINNIVLKELKSKINICINESNKISYTLTESSDNDVLRDLINHRAYATMFLFLNENYKLKIDKSTFINEANVKDFYQDCQNLLQENVKVVTEKGPLLTSIKGYPIYEVENGILRGAGEKKIFESFEAKDDYYRQMDKKFKRFCKNMELDSNDLDSVLEALDELEGQFGDSEGEYQELREFIYNELIESDNLKKSNSTKKSKLNKNEELNEEGTQCSDIASKVDQNLGINKPKIVTTKINGLKENVSLRGFLRNEKGQYERGNYILCLENNNYVAIHKDKLNEDGNEAFKNISTIQNTIQSKTGCTVNVEKDNNKVIIHIKGTGSQLATVMPYGDELKKLLQAWGNTVEFDVNDNEFVYTAY